METILSIAGKPGLYKLVSRGNRKLIVETIDETHRRIPAFATDRVTSLGDIAMYTDADEIALWEVLESVGKKENSQVSSLNYKKCSAQELHDYFAEVLPNYDRDRVHDSDIKKLLQWYNILVKNGITDFKATLAPTDGDNVDDRQEEAAAESSLYIIIYIRGCVISHIQCARKMSHRYYRCSQIYFFCFKKSV